MAVDLPGDLHAQRVRDRRKDVDRLEGRIDDAPAACAGLLQEEWDGPELRERRIDRLSKWSFRPEGGAVIGDDRDDRAVVEPNLLQPIEDHAEESIDKLHLEEMPLVVQCDETPIVTPVFKLVQPGQSRARRSNLSRRQIDERLVGQQDVQEVQHGCIVSLDPLDPLEHASASIVITLAGPPPLPETKSESPPVMSHRRKACRQCRRQHDVPVDDGEIGRDSEPQRRIIAAGWAADRAAVDRAR